MVQISEHRGYKIEYDSDNLFHVMIDNWKSMHHKSESDAKKQVDTHIEIEDDLPHEPELKFNCTVKNVPGKLLDKQVRGCDVVAESFNLIGEEGCLKINGKGDIEKYEGVIRPDNDIEIVTGGEGNTQIKSKYSIEYLKKMSLGNNISKECKLEFSNDYPLKISFEIKERASLSFILAPRIDNE